MLAIVSICSVKARCLPMLGKKSGRQRRLQGCSSAQGFDTVIRGEQRLRTDFHEAFPG